MGRSRGPRRRTDSPSRD